MDYLLNLWLMLVAYRKEIAFHSQYASFIPTLTAFNRFMQYWSYKSIWILS